LTRAEENALICWAVILAETFAVDFPSAFVLRAFIAIREGVAVDFPVACVGLVAAFNLFQSVAIHFPDALV